MNIKEKVDVAIDLYTKLPKNIIIDGITYYLDIDFGNIIHVYYIDANIDANINPNNSCFASIIETSAYWDNIEEIYQELLKEKIIKKFKIENDVDLKDYINLKNFPKIIYDTLTGNYSYLYILYNMI